MKKLKIEVKLENILDWGEFSLNDFIKKLQDKEKEYIKRGFSDFVVKDDSYYEYSSLTLYGKRDETDQEYKKRMSIAARMKTINKKNKENKLVKEKELYEKLRKQFEEN